MNRYHRFVTFQLLCSDFKHQNECHMLFLRGVLKIGIINANSLLMMINDLIFRNLLSKIDYKLSYIKL